MVARIRGGPIAHARPKLPTGRGGDPPTTRERADEKMCIKAIGLVEREDVGTSKPPADAPVGRTGEGPCWRRMQRKT
jgi:hypothetical protein